MKKIIFIALLLMATQAMGTTITVKLPATVGAKLDSCELIVTLFDGTARDSVVMCGTANKRQDIDTSITVDSDTTYSVWYKLWYKITDSVAVNYVFPTIWKTTNSVTSGAGGSSVVYRAVDVTNNDTLSGVTIIVNTMLGVEAGRIITPADNDGVGTFTLATDSFTFIGFRNGYTFETDTLLVSALDTGTLIATKIADPDAAPTENVIACFIDLGSGIIDSVSGLMIPRSNIQLTLTLVGAVSLNDGTWAFIPEVHKARPSTAGRATFRVIANSVLTPTGSYYVLTYRAFDGRSSFIGQIKKFYLDTTTDPINILDATELYR